MSDWELVENDPDAARGIVNSLRVYIHACAQTGTVPRPSHMAKIAFAKDEGTKAMIAAIKSD